jgi:hypothetical protein
MNPFEAHEIAHLSPSSLNTFLTSPAAFVLQKVLKRTTPVGAAAHRGTAVEHGVALGLADLKKPVEECVKEAESRFGGLTAFTTDPRTEKEAAAIGKMVINGLKELRPYGVPTGTQGAIRHEVEGLLVPLIGYYDFAWQTGDVNVLTDLKTTHALPSKIRTKHARQVALYKAAIDDNLEARVTYVTGVKFATYHLENSREHLDALCRTAMTVQRFLSLSKDPHELAALVMPDTDSFYFSDPLARAQVYEVWNV